MHFRGEYAFLSNFYLAPILLNGLEYKTVEHAYASAKAARKEDAEVIRLCATASQAKRLGRSVQIRSNWNLLKLDVMLKALYAKFEQHPQLAQKLLDTGNIELVEDNTWNDTFWGRCNNRGENHLGKLLMQIRDDLSHRSESSLF